MEDRHFIHFLMVLCLGGLAALAVVSETLDKDDQKRRTEHQEKWESLQKNEPDPLADHRKAWSHSGRIDSIQVPYGDPEGMPRDGIVLMSEKWPDFRQKERGLDGKDHAYPAFLLGFKPFEVRPPWLLLRLIGDKLKYSLDSEFFSGEIEMWQTSMQAYRFMRGDCEDHAILLADWLHAMGYDARVVVGLHGLGGHAWVVLFEEGKTYIMEATDKYSNRHLPLAEKMTNYIPQYMFNPHFVWIRTEEPTYKPEDWSLVYRFTGKIPAKSA